MIDLSIIIVNRNTRQLLQQCLSSIYDTTRNIVFDVYVVDNDSSDSSVEMVKKEFPQVKLIENKRNEGFARANNRGMRRVKGRYIFLLNSDTVVLNQALTKMIAFMDKNKETAVLGCKLLNKDGSLQLSAAWFPSLANVILGSEIVPQTLAQLFRIKKIPGQTYLTAKDHDRVQEIDWVVGACMLVRHEVIDQVGLLDENIFLYSEEIEWCLRIKKAKWKIVYFPGARITHLGSGSTKALSKTTLYKKVFAERYVYHKHHAFMLSLIYDFLNFTISLLKLFLWSMLLLVVADKNKALVHLYYYQGVMRSLIGGKQTTENWSEKIR